MSTILTFVGQLLLICCSNALSETSKLETRLISAGNNVTFSCYSRTASIQWVYLESKQSQNTYAIELNNPTNAHLREMYDQVLPVTSNGSNLLILTLLEVTPKHAGIYNCRDPLDDVSITVKDVGVLVSEPKCAVGTLSTNDINTMLHIECSVNYTGNWIPVFTCQPNPHLTKRSDESFNRTHSVVHVHSYNVTHLRNLTKNVTCELHFDRTELCDAAFSLPKYMNRWQFTTALLTTVQPSHERTKSQTSQPQKTSIPDSTTFKVQPASNSPFMILLIVVIVLIVILTVAINILIIVRKTGFICCQKSTSKSSATSQTPAVVDVIPAYATVNRPSQTDLNSMATATFASNDNVLVSLRNNSDTTSLPAYHSATDVSANPKTPMCARVLPKKNKMVASQPSLHKTNASVDCLATKSAGVFGQHRNREQQTVLYATVLPKTERRSKSQTTLHHTEISSNNSSTPASRVNVQRGQTAYRQGYQLYAEMT